MMGTGADDIAAFFEFRIRGCIRCSRHLSICIHREEKKGGQFGIFRD